MISDLPKLFLDTTIQIDGLFETPAHRREIRRQLEAAECTTSTLVLCEFKFRVVRACISLWSILQEEDSDANVETRIARHFQRETGILLKVYAELKREACPDGRFDKGLLLETLIDYIRGRLVERFCNAIATSSGGPRWGSLMCEVARRGIVERRGLFHIDTRCQRRTASCNLSGIYQQAEDRLQRLHGLLVGQGTVRTTRGLRPRDRLSLSRIERVLSAALKCSRWKVVNGKRNCSVLADLTILLDSPKGSAVYTTDRGFQQLFDLVGLPGRLPPRIHRYSQM